MKITTIIKLNKGLAERKRLLEIARFKLQLQCENTFEQNGFKVDDYYKSHNTINGFNSFQLNNCRYRVFFKLKENLTYDIITMNNRIDATELLFLQQLVEQMVKE